MLALPPRDGRILLTVTVLVLICSHAASGLCQEIKFHKPPIRRLSPRSFPQLPHRIVRSLEAGKYTIPQIWMDPQAPDYHRPLNVIKGSFRRKGQIDWAVLASRND